MKLAVFSPVFGDLSLEEMLKYLYSHGIHSLELGCGGFPGTKHADARALIKNNADVENLKNLLVKYDVEICALSCHGNCVHPDKHIRDEFQKDFEACCILAEKLGVTKIITFSGCPGDCENSLYPNWVTCFWPTDFVKILDYQWNDVLIPYWRKAAAFAENHGVTKIALELHPGFCCYNPETLLKLRSAVGNIIGANFDPSHLLWQGIDPCRAMIELRGAIYHFHAKDTFLNKDNIEKNGVLDTKDFADEINRSWIFRTVGYGNDTLLWKNMLSTLNMLGYDDAVSIEHEDSLIAGLEGLDKAIDFLKPIIPITPKPTNLWWN